MPRRSPARWSWRTRASGRPPPPRDLERIEAVARAVVNRLLHEPTLQMKALRRRPRARPHGGHPRPVRADRGGGRPAGDALDAAPPRTVRGRFRGRGGDPRAARSGSTARLMRVGTRGSALALVQARWVAERLGPGIEVVEISHAGRSRRRRERQVALGLASWSARCWTAGSTSPCTRPRTSPQSCPRAWSWWRFPSAPRPATSSAARPRWPSWRRAAASARAACAAPPRCARCAQIWRLRELRGNVDTRLRKLAAGEADALVLAAAGLQRLGRADEAGGVLDEFVPAAGQGALALEARAGAIAPRAARCRLRPSRDGVRGRRARARPRPGRHLQHAGGRPRMGAGRWPPHAAPPGWASPTARRGCATRSPPPPPRCGMACAERMLAAGAAELLRQSEAR